MLKSKKIKRPDWWPDGKEPYILWLDNKVYTTPDRPRVEFLSPQHAKVRNAHRKQNNYKGEWTKYPDAKQHEVTGGVAMLAARKERADAALPAPKPSKVLKPIDKNGNTVEVGLWRVWKGTPKSSVFVVVVKAKSEAEAIKRAIEVKKKPLEPGKCFARPKYVSKEELAERRRLNALAQQQKETEVKDKNKSAKADKSEKKEKKVEKKESSRPNWNGYNMCAIIRWCGSKGYTKNQIKAVVKHCKFEASDTTILIQRKKGEDGENVPELKGSESKELKGIAAAAPKEEPKAKKSKKDKGEKKSKKDKSGKKKAKKEEPADEDSDGEDDSSEDTSDEDEGADEAEADAAADSADEDDE